MTATTLSSREFNQDTAKAKRAAENGPVFITDRGRTAHVLLTYEAYEKLAEQKPRKSILELLAMPEGADICEDFDALIPRSRELPRPADLS